MKKLICMFVFLLGVLALAVSCTKEPTKLVNGSLKDSYTYGGNENGTGIINGGANTDAGFGELHPVGGSPAKN